MPSPTESAVMAFFFAMRSARKYGPPDARQQRLNEAVIERARWEQGQREYVALVKEQAARDAWERAAE